VTARRADAGLRGAGVLRRYFKHRSLRRNRYFARKIATLRTDLAVFADFL
jgi:hypothetical protein